MAVMNSENHCPPPEGESYCPPPEEDDDLSVSSARAGAAVFGSLVFGAELADHSLCYSPSPMVSRHNKENVPQPLDGKVLSFAKSAASPSKPRVEPAEKSTVKRSNAVPRVALMQREPKRKVIPQRKNLRPVGLPRKASGPKKQTGNVVGGSSVNPVINGVRRSKEESLKEKATSVAELRERRRQEREEVAAFNVKAEQTRREVIELRKKLNERFRQAKVERELRSRSERLAKVETEIRFKSRVHVEHKRTLKEQEDARRRRSTHAKARMRQNHREGTERMRLASIAEDQALYEERHEGSVAMRTTKADNAEKRRMSFAFRNGHARRIREIFAEREAERKYEEHESYELKWAGERDAEAHQRQMARQRRESLAGRNAEGQRIRDLEAEMAADAQHAEHESYELKWAGERDAEDYQEQMAEERRNSFAFRNAEGQSIRDLEAEMAADAQHAEHESYELKWAGERDAEDYKKRMAEERRNSFAFRNADGQRIRDLEAEMAADALHAEHESYELKWEGEKDAEDYQREMAQQRRESLAGRNAEGVRIRDLEAENAADALHAEHESYELKWAGERDAEDYKKRMARQRRESLAGRNAEGQRIRDLEAEQAADAQHAEHESYELKWAGEKDAEAHQRRMAEERRNSLAFRNADGQRVCDLEAEMAADALHAEHESYELKWAGERDAENYKRQMEEERRESLRFRNQEAARRDAVMSELRSLAQQREHESFVLKWAGENDAKNYLADQAELRRLSFAFRNSEGRRHRDIEEEMRVAKVIEMAQDEELKAAGQRDVQEYKEECAAEERASLQLDGKEHFKSRMEAENDQQQKLHEDHESHLLDTAAWQDVNDYIKECGRRKRLSLAFRAREKRRHLEVEREQHAQRIEQQRIDTLWRSEDARYVEMAKLKEKARLALEAFNRSPECTFGTNPFRTLLD